MLGISGWMGLGLAVYSVATTLLAFWLAVRLWGRGQPVPFWSPRAIAGNLLWSALLTFASIIAARYIERVQYEILAYAAYALIGLLLSLARADLWLRATQARDTESRPQRSRLSREEIVPNLNYLLLALVLLLLVFCLTGGPVSPIVLIPLFLGALLPDLDASDSLLGRLLPAISRLLEHWLGHNQAWHTPAAALVLAGLTAPLALLVNGDLAAWWYALPLGFLAHLLLDLLTPQGVMLLWPLSRARFRLPGARDQTPGGRSERRLVVGLTAIVLILLVVVGLGSKPSLPAAPPPSYEETLDRYHGLRGRYLVFAYVQGTWQTSGLRLGGRFEVLNALRSSYVLLDRYTGNIFTAGRSPEDHVYLESISLQTGSEVKIKPVEIALERKPLAETLAVLYEMQAEPGLEYIYVFGNLVLAADPSGTQPALPIDQNLTGVPRIQAVQPGCYRLQYLNAAELIRLAGVDVETADLLIVATYTSPAARPTVTPLPSPPAAAEAGP